GSAFPGRDTVLIQRKLQAQGSLELADSLHGWERFRLQYLSLDVPRVTAFAIMMSLVLIVGFCHLRFSWWPFHPVMFVFLGSGHGQMISLSLLLGWAVKAGVNKYGGARLYHRLKPVMIGLIAGDVVARFIPMAVGAVYFMFTGQKPVSGGL
ncbi:MAG: hypothetical protein NTZ61_15775, partial [Proteobacteria bacterium]|nr:hypothetical protein [Pseudomonadota bacterium]